MSSLRPMVLVLKKLLAARNLNDPFSGGLSSYGLCLMVMFLLLKQRKLLARSKSGGGGGSEVASFRCVRQKKKISRPILTRRSSQIRR